MLPSDSDWEKTNKAGHQNSGVDTRFPSTTLCEQKQGKKAVKETKLALSEEFKQDQRRSSCG